MKQNDAKFTVSSIDGFLTKTVFYANGVTEKNLPSQKGNYSVRSGTLLKNQYSKLVRVFSSSNFYQR
jgi:hypothetical protein